MAKSKHPTPADAQIILELYDMRREAELRKARSWFGNFQPQSFEDVQKIALAVGTQENAWYRQVLSYWDMAASIALRGAVNLDLLLDNAGEMYFIFAKLRPYIEQVREHGNPEFLARIEKLALSTKEGRERLAAMEKRMAVLRLASATAGGRTA